MKTFQYLLVAVGEPANVELFSGIYDRFALCILTAIKAEDAKELKLLFKELYHCMRVVSENEAPENRAVLADPTKLQTFGGVLAKACEVVSKRKQEKAALIEEKQENG